MTLHVHARCDRCERVEHEVMDEDDLVELGWLVAHYGPDDDNVAHFCSLGCLGRWAGSPEARSVVEAVESRDTEDE